MTPLQKVLFIASPLLIVGLIIIIYSLTHSISVLSIQGLIAVVCFFLGAQLFFKNLAKHLDSRQTHQQ